jgi:mannitol-1-phosphate/altronate dehydrogenase
MLVVAAWIHYLRTHEGHVETLDDSRGDVLRSLARLGGDDPRPLLSLTGVFGTLGANDGLVRDLRHTLRDLRVRGVAHVLRSWTTRQNTLAWPAVPAVLTEKLAQEDARARSS